MISLTGGLYQSARKNERRRFVRRDERREHAEEYPDAETILADARNVAIHKLGHHFKQSELITRADGEPALRPQPREPIEYAAPRLFVEHARRLVEEHYLRLFRHGARYANALLLAARQFRR